MGVGQRQIHVVAAQEDMLAHRDAVQFQGTVLLGDGDQRQIRGATAHVHHQDQIAHLHLLAPVTLGGLDPAVERRLGFFQQHQVTQTGLLGGLGGEFPGGRVEGGGYRQGQRLLVQGMLRELVIPCLA